jgi:hypothetical protein
MKARKGFPGPMTKGQMGAYKGIQKAENWPGGLNIRAGNELGFRSEGRSVKRGADKSSTFGMKIRKA